MIAAVICIAAGVAAAVLFSLLRHGKCDDAGILYPEKGNAAPYSILKTFKKSIPGARDQKLHLKAAKPGKKFNMPGFVKKAARSMPLFHGSGPAVSHEAGLIRYNTYVLTSAEKFKYWLLAAAVLFSVGFLFFKSPYISAFLCGFSFLYPPYKKKDLMTRRKNLLNQQFRDALFSIASSLSSGKSVEGAFRAALDDLKILYDDENALIIKEFELLNRRMDRNETLDRALLDFAERADIEDIKNFADVLIICKNTGGNLIEVVRNASNIINQKIDIKNEMQVVIAEQKFSQKVLNMVPFGLLSMMAAGSPEYMAPLYSLKGHMAMFLVLMLLAASYVISSKITDIEI
ncbi:MAG: type II secretion system F family protein [Clostridiales bacterium]|jgi:tight adherence protein B|nr:type II secretion system F family protein [Eubacteriales bacterium]MDH7566300.1 type II secretion system F family protein [Clostridiales bacterium]